MIRLARVFNMSRKPILLSFQKTILLSAFVFVLFVWLRALKDIYWAPLLEPKSLTARLTIELVLYIFVSAGTFFALLAITLRDNISFFNVQHSKFWLLISLGYKALALLVPFYLFFFSSWGRIFTDPWLHIIPFSSSIAIDQLFLSPNEQPRRFSRLVSAFILISALTIISSRARYILDFPFPLGWSEGNRFWDYSVLFASQKYLNPTTQPVYAFLETGRQVLWGILFLIPKLSIQVMRLWNAALYLILPIILGWILFRKKNKLSAAIAALFTLAYLSQGPVYPSLLLIAIGCALAARTENIPFKTGITALMCYYASTARFTWIAAPLVLMTIPEYTKPENTSLQKLTIITIRYTLAGVVGGLVLPAIFPLSAPTYSPGMISNQTTLVQKALNMLAEHPLIWGRLWPNSTNTLGITGALAFAVLPLLSIVLLFKRKSSWRWSVWQSVFIATVIGAALAVGLVVSVKIGGGSNLHNLDMFMLSVLFLAAATWQHRKADWNNFFIHSNWLTKGLVLFMALWPAGKALLQAAPLNLPDTRETSKVLNTISTQISEKSASGEVLFIDHRQLLAFDLIPQIPLVVEYEKKVLMNEALSADAEYFMTFYKDLKNHRFALIVNEPLFITYQADDALYGQENDAYVRWVSEPLLCFYESLLRYDRQRIELLVPRTSPRPENLTCPE